MAYEMDTAQESEVSGNDICEQANNMDEFPFYYNKDITTGTISSLCKTLRNDFGHGYTFGLDTSIDGGISLLEWPKKQASHKQGQPQKTVIITINNQKEPWPKVDNSISTLERWEKTKPSTIWSVRHSGTFLETTNREMVQQGEKAIRGTIRYEALNGAPQWDRDDIERVLEALRKNGFCAKMHRDPVVASPLETILGIQPLDVGEMVVERTFDDDDESERKGGHKYELVPELGGSPTRSPSFSSVCVSQDKLLNLETGKRRLDDKRGVIVLERGDDKKDHSSTRMRVSVCPVETSEKRPCTPKSRKVSALERRLEDAKRRAVVALEEIHKPNPHGERTSQTEYERKRHSSPLQEHRDHHNKKNHSRSPPKYSSPHKSHSPTIHHHSHSNSPSHGEYHSHSHTHSSMIYVPHPQTRSHDYINTRPHYHDGKRGGASFQFGRTAGPIPMRNWHNAFRGHRNGWNISTNRFFPQKNVWNGPFVKNIHGYMYGAEHGGMHRWNGTNPSWRMEGDKSKPYQQKDDTMDNESKSGSFLSNEETPIHECGNSQMVGWMVGEHGERKQQWISGNDGGRKEGGFDKSDNNRNQRRTPMEKGGRGHHRTTGGRSASPMDTREGGYGRFMDQK
jgi:hypothetical protein